MESMISMDLDGKSFEMPGETSFSDVSKNIKNQVAPKRVLTEIYVDQKAIDLDEEERISKLPIAKLGKLRFVTKPVEELLKESSLTAISICEALKPECDEIDELFEKNEIVKAHQRVGELTALIEWLLQLMSSLHSYGGVSFGEHQISSGMIKDSAKGMEACLFQLHQSLGQKNYTQFRKDLKGRFQEEVSVWKEVFSAVSKHWTPRV